MKIEESGSTFEIGTESEYVVEKYPCIGFIGAHAGGFLTNYTFENGEVKFFDNDSPSCIRSFKFYLHGFRYFDNIFLGLGGDTRSLNTTRIEYYEVKKDFDIKIEETGNITDKIKKIADLPILEDYKNADVSGGNYSFTVMDSGIIIVLVDVSMDTEPTIRTLKWIGRFDKDFKTIRWLNMGANPDYQRIKINPTALWHKIAENKYLTVAYYEKINTHRPDTYLSTVAYDENTNDIILTKISDPVGISAYDSSSSGVFLNNVFYYIAGGSTDNCQIFKYENSRFSKVDNPHTFNKPIAKGNIIDKLTNDKLLIVGMNEQQPPDYSTELQFVIGTIESDSEVTWSEVKSLQLQGTIGSQSCLLVINEKTILLPTGTDLKYEVYRYDSASNSLIKSYSTQMIAIRQNGFFPIRPMSYITRKSKPFSLTVDSNSDATMMLNGINVYDTLNTFESTANNLQNTVQVSRTVTHEAPFTGNIIDYEIGVPVFATGVVKSYDFSTNSWVTTTNSTNCITEVKLEGDSSTFVGITVGYVAEDGERIYNNHDLNVTIKSKTIRSILFASHGDFYFKVNDSSKYNIGDTVMVNGEVIDDETVLTQDIKNQIIGTCTAKVNDGMIAVFRS